MKFSRSLPVAALFLIGVAALVAGIACGGSDDAPTSTTTAVPTQASQRAETPTATATASPTSTNTPTPSPTPYNGLITRIKIPRFNVDAPIESLDLDANLAMETPRNENTGVAWYYRWDKPGRANPENAGGWAHVPGYDKPGYKGNSIFSAHIYYHEKPAPFQNVQKLVVGDDVSVIMDDGREYRYKVIAAPQVIRLEELTAARMTEVIWPSNKPVDKEWLTLFSCGGEFDPVTREYYSRVIVITERTQ